MNKKRMTCPACGSQEVLRFEDEGFDQLTLGDKFSFKQVNYKCNSCEEEGDFSEETDKNFLVAQKVAQGNLVKEILKNMNNIGISMAMFERVFELPARTLTRWKNEDFSSSALALLRIIITYPWIVDVAEHKFEKKYSKCAVIKAAAEEFNEIKVNSNDSSQVSGVSSGSSAFFIGSSGAVNSMIGWGA